MNAILYIIAGPAFLISLAAHIYVKLRLRPGDDLDDYYWEFEDRHPALAKYEKWSKITFAVTALSALMLLLAAVI